MLFCHCLCGHWNGNGTSFGWTRRWAQGTANGCFIFICGRKRFPHTKTAKSIGFDRKTEKTTFVNSSSRSQLHSISIRIRYVERKRCQRCKFFLSRLRSPNAYRLFLGAIANGMPCVRDLFQHSRNGSLHCVFVRCEAVPFKMLCFIYHWFSS